MRHVLYLVFSSPFFQGSYIVFISKLFSRVLCEILISYSMFVHWKVFSSFASAAIRIRSPGIRKLLRLSSDNDTDGSVSQYNFGMVLKETMLSLGPTFIKGKEYCLVEV